jgi:hypothetical protein
MPLTWTQVLPGSISADAFPAACASGIVQNRAYFLRGKAIESKLEANSAAIQGWLMNCPEYTVERRCWMF